jgi:large subunit ribosomal protein L35
MAGCNKARGKKPKIKTNKSAKKRFKLTSNGMIKHVSQGRQHCLSNKSRKRKRQLVKKKYLSVYDSRLKAYIC